MTNDQVELLLSERDDISEFLSRFFEYRFAIDKMGRLSYAAI